MTDLIERLRAGTGGGKHWMDLHTEAADEIERLRSYLAYDANCPCCSRSDECEDGCTFAEDAPDDYSKMVEVRAILNPPESILKALKEKGLTK